MRQLFRRACVDARSQSKAFGVPRNWYLETLEKLTQLALLRCQRIATGKTKCFTKEEDFPSIRRSDEMM